MILYNVTIIINEEIESDWLIWMQNTHIPDVMSTQCFISNRILKVLDSPNEGITYCVQYIAEDLIKFEGYKSNFSSKLQAAYPETFSNKFVSFRTVMEFIE